MQNFGRRQPALMIGGAFLLGFAGARIIKSSMDAAASSTNTGIRSSANPGAQQQSFNANIPGAQPPAPPPNPNPAL